MLEIKNIEYSYKKEKQTYRYDFSLKAGEIIVISGVSGAGKSTLLDIIAGFLTANSGEIILDQVKLTNLAPEHRPISILFQDENLFEHLSVEKNLALAFSKAIIDKEKIAIALKNVGLVGYEKRWAKSLSGGQKQRVALARTLLRNTPILLLDEPFNALDKKTVKDMRLLVKNLVKQYKWHTIIVSHNIEDAAELNAKNYVMKNGILKKT